MPNKSRPDLVKQAKEWIARNKILAAMIIIGTVVIAIASFTNALLDINSFARTISLSQTPTPIPTSPSIRYYAPFGIQFPEGAWKEGETYSYSLEVRQCGSDNFNGDMVNFVVKKGLADAPFYLLKDGIYDSPDMNIAKPVTASPSQSSYAVVIISKSSNEDALHILITCEAFINIKSGPSLALEPSKPLNTLISLPNLNPSEFNIAP